MIKLHNTISTILISFQFFLVMVFIFCFGTVEEYGLSKEAFDAIILFLIAVTILFQFYFKIDLKLGGGTIKASDPVGRFVGLLCGLVALFYSLYLLIK
jgi:hypothetical protein